MRRLMTFGFGRKKASCESTSASKDWCDSAFLAFMMRTTAASIATVRSSSTRFGLCDSSSDAIGTLIFRIGHENLGLTAKESVKATLELIGVFPKKRLHRSVPERPHPRDPSFRVFLIIVVL